MKNGLGIKHAEVISAALKWLNLGIGQDRDIVKHVLKIPQTQGQQLSEGSRAGVEG